VEQMGTPACPVTAVFKIRRLASHPLARRVDLPGGGATTTQKFTAIQDPYNLIGAARQGAYTTANGLFDDCYWLASSQPLPPDFILNAEQNHLLGGQTISKNEVTYYPDRIHSAPITGCSRAAISGPAVRCDPPAATTANSQAAGRQAPVLTPGGSGLGRAIRPLCGGCSQPQLTFGAADDPLEYEADAVAEQVMPRCAGISNPRIVRRWEYNPASGRQLRRSLTRPHMTRNFILLDPTPGGDSPQRCEMNGFDALPPAQKGAESHLFSFLSMSGLEKPPCG